MNGRELVPDKGAATTPLRHGRWLALSVPYTELGLPSINIMS